MRVLVTGNWDLPAHHLAFTYQQEADLFERP